VQADNISALFLAMTHASMLRLAADQPPLLWCYYDFSKFNMAAASDWDFVSK